MYSKYDDPNYRPIPGEREKDKLCWLRLERERLARELAAVDSEIQSLETLPYVLDTPLPIR